MHRSFSARGYVGKARRRREKNKKKLMGNGRPKITAVSFTRSRFRGRGPVALRDHYCYLCGNQERTLSNRMCNSCNRWIKYNYDKAFHEKEIERNRRYRETHRVENRERAKKYRRKSN